MKYTTYLWDSDLKLNLPHNNYESWNVVHRAYRFFRTEGHAPSDALALARAECWAKSSDLVGVTREDERAYCYCDSDSCKYHEGSKHTWETVMAMLVKACPDHYLDCFDDTALADGCAWRTGHGDPHALYPSPTLGGIMDPTENDLRTTYAELAMEALANESAFPPYRYEGSNAYAL